MALVVKRAGAEEYGQWVKMLLAGDPGAGKTRLSSTAPNVLYANLEGGLMSVTDRQPAFIDINRSDDLSTLRLTLAQPPEVRKRHLGVDVETVCIDTIDNLQKLLIAERLEEQHKESMAMADWGWLGDQLRGVVRSFRNLPMHVIFTCHIKTVEDSETGRTYVKPALQGAMQDEIPAYVDLAVLLRAQPTTKVIDDEARRVLSRTMQTFPDLNHPWLKDRSGKLPMEFDINLDNDFLRIVKAIFGEIDTADSQIVGQVQIEGTDTGDEVVDQARKSAAAKKAAAKKAAPKISEKASQAAGQALSQVTPVVDEPAAGGADQASATTDVDEPAPEPEIDDGSSSTDVAEAEAAPQELKTETADEPAATPTQTVVDDGRIRCENPDCLSGGYVENEDQADLSRIRFRKVLCRACFTAAKKK